jgi:branched-chain amino acid transport system substrate-binding protein
METVMRFSPKALALSIALGLSLGSSVSIAQTAAKPGAVNLKETVKIAWIDPLSGLMGAGGQQPAQDLPVLRREVQRQQPGGREVRGHLASTTS